MAIKITRKPALIEEIPPSPTPDTLAYIEKVKALKSAVPEKQRYDRPGRPSSGKIRITMLLKPETVEKFKASGKGWQARMSDVLDKAAGL